MAKITCHSNQLQNDPLLPGKRGFCFFSVNKGKNPVAFCPREISAIRPRPATQCSASKNRPENLLAFFMLIDSGKGTGVRGDKGIAREI
jgi:hypothetical protein